jgi:hypothetical protein
MYGGVEQNVWRASSCIVLLRRAVTILPEGR